MRIAVIHASAGHGHARAAEAIREGLIASGVPEEQILLLDALDETPAWFRALYTSVYYYSVKHTPQAWGAVYKLFDLPFVYRSLARPLRRLVNGGVAKGLVRRMIQEKPDAILFTHFLAPEVLGRAKERGQLSSFLVTVVTDFLPHSFWVNPGTDHYWVMSGEGKENLRERGIPEERITAAGIPIALRFRPQGKKKELRRKEGLAEGLFTILITSGSFGLGPAAEVLDCLGEFGNQIQVMVVCGRNQNQYRFLEGKRYPFPTRLYGFISHMDTLMEASDLIIAKPGGATTAESLAKGLPMVVLKPIPGQETGNARLLKERNASFFLGKPSDIRIIVKGILDYPIVLEEKRRSIERIAKPDAALELARFVLKEIGL